MKEYKILKKQIFSDHNHSIVPIRYEDRYDIMKWRNQQMYHLRQSRPLMVDDQEKYFENVILKLYEQKRPDQILFSYLQNEICVGYGGLVHINWEDKNAELSFIMNTELESLYFEYYWNKYLDLIEKVAFEELRLHKIYSYAFDLRPQLYVILESKGFKKEAELKDHAKIKKEYVNVIMHSKVNKDENR